MSTPPWVPRGSPRPSRIAAPLSAVFPLRVHEGLLGADGRKAGILAALNRADPDHDGAREALRADRGPLIVPAGILAEAGYTVEVDLGAAVLRQFVSDLHDGYYELDCGEGDFKRIGELLERYADMALGLADACVIDWPSVAANGC